jgi:hypothetical protein
MTCKIDVSLISEFVDGNVGNDWQYSLAAEVPDAGEAGSGRIDVPRHTLKPGTTRDLTDPPSVTIDAGPCAGRVRVVLTLAAAEVDWVFSDTGEDSAVLEIDCPGAGEDPVSREREVSAYVEERPRVLGGSANFVVKVRAVARCE